MANKRISYRILFIIVPLLFIFILLAFRYFPFSKILRTQSGKALSMSLPAASGPQGPNSILFDFEVAPGKDVPNGVVLGNAHSGRYAAKAFGKNSFSPALERTAGELGIDKLKHISISAWVFVKPGNDPVNAALVIAASNSVGVNICWKGTGLRDPGVPRGKWFKMSGQFDLSDVKFGKDDRIQMYFWNNSSNDILVDDYYLVYGGTVPRRGDTTFTDLTKGPYTARFNYPPFPVKCLRMTETQGLEAGKNNAEKEVEKLVISPGDPMISGKFIAGNGGLDVLFTIFKNRKPMICHYCGSGRFRKTEVQNTAGLSSGGSGKLELLKGKFIVGECEQLLYLNGNSCGLLKLSGKGDPCSEGYSVDAETLWQQGKQEINDFNAGGSLITGDFDGDGLCEVLAVDPKGLWKLFRFQSGKGSNGKWNLSAQSKESLADWEGTDENVHLTADHFLPGRNQVQVLAVKENNKPKNHSFSLRIYDAAGKNFVPFFPEKYSRQGRIIGIDTLKPGDRFFCGNFGITGTPTVMRYNREWRFDLKEISFNDTTYHILNNIDFAGYPANHNPKYYEILKLIPGRFTGNQSSFIVIGRNCRDRNYNGKDCKDFENLTELPDFISLYLFVSR